MKIAAVALRRARWELDGRGAARGRRERAAIVVEVTTVRGARGYGEAAPLEGLSLESLEEAGRVLEAFAARAPLEVGEGLDAIAALAAAVEAEGLARGAGEAAGHVPSARFAIEAALLDALAAERGTTLGALLEVACGAPGRLGLPASAVIDDEAEARAAVAAGAQALKLKVGPGGDLDRVRAITAAAPGVRLRLDANRSWPRAEVRERLTALADLPIDYVEEPCPDAHELLLECETLALPIALDESLVALSRDTPAARAALEAALRAPGLGALVLKPTLLGLSGAIDLAARARTAGVPAIATHALESPIGQAVAAALAQALAGSAETARAPAVSIGGTARSFADIAVLRSREPVRCVIATPTVETLAEIHAALSERRPIALLHAKLPAAEVARQRAAVETAELPAGAAAILFTSGSTGSPRGVVLSRDALDAAADASARHLGWRADDRWLLALSTAHAGGLAVCVRCLAARMPIVLVEEGGDLAAALAASTLASLVPSQLAALLEDPAWRPPPQLRAVLLGGAAASPALLSAAAARGVPFLATYGMTESFGQVATAPPDRTGDPAAPLVPLPGVELLAGTPGAPAPIRVRAPMLAPRYLDGAPVAPELVTADLGWLEGGALHIAGRADDTIVTGGAKVHPLEVEAVLAATPGVRAACAFAVPDERWGHVVGAALATAPGFDLAAAAVHWHAALPPRARPRRLALVDALPLTPTGKPDRRAAARLPLTPLRY